MSSLKTLHPGFRPGMTYAAACQVPPLTELPPALEPTDFGLLPPIMHYGYIIDRSQFSTIGTAKFGITRETSGGGWEEVALHMVANDIAGAVVDYPIKVVRVCTGLKRPLILSLSSNWYPCERLEELDARVREYLGIEERGKWYLDNKQWFWRK